MARPVPQRASLTLAESLEYPVTLAAVVRLAVPALGGGRMWVDSAPGAGTTFFFSIPLAAAPEMSRV